ncbi:hypothetical protein AURANDRAFT_68906, partial [Aureococcus anophagefferens]
APGEPLDVVADRVACALEESGEDVAGVVCLAALGAGAALGDDVAGATREALKTFLALLKALDDRGDAPRVVVATRGAADDPSLDGVAASAPDAALASCAVWGMARSAAAEAPERRFRLVDLCPCEPSRDRDAACLLDELAAETPASRAESAWRKRARKAPRLAPLPVPRLLEAGPVVDADLAAGVHVVSGGTGGLGVEWAKRLAAAGGDAATLVLASRRAPSPALAADLASLARDTGATVVVERADVSRAAGAEALLARGAALRATPATKLRVWHLAGVTDYGAANGGLDALAALRASRRDAARCLSVQWGPWAGIGMASRIKSLGSGSEGAPFLPLNAADAFDGLDAALGGAAPVAAVVRFDAACAAAAAARAPHVRAFLGGALGDGGAAAAGGAAEPPAADPGAEAVAVFAQHTSAPVALDSALETLALDSLEVTAIVRDLEARTGAKLELLDVLSAATVGDVAKLVGDARRPRKGGALDAVRRAAASRRIDVARLAKSTAALSFRDADAWTRALQREYPGAVLDVSRVMACATADD